MLDLNRLALLTGITGFVGAIPAVQRFFRTLTDSSTTRPGVAWLAVPLLVIFLVGITELGFFWCLYRNRVPLFVPKRARLAALLGAIVTGGIILVTLPSGMNAFVYGVVTLRQIHWSDGATSVISAFRDFGAFALIARVVNYLHATAYILLLVVLIRRPSDDPPAAPPPSRELRYFALALAIELGIWVVFCLLRLAMWPSIYRDMVRNLVLQIEPPVPSVWMGMAEILRGTMHGVSIFAAPYAVYLTCVFVRSDDTSVVPQLPPGSTP